MTSQSTLEISVFFILYELGANNIEIMICAYAMNYGFNSRNDQNSEQMLIIEKSM